jgi:hypothetical protein
MTCNGAANFTLSLYGRLKTMHRLYGLLYIVPVVSFDKKQSWIFCIRRLSFGS